jgi:TPR repeat protein
MSNEDEKKTGLVPSQSAAVSRTGGTSLATRGLRDLLETESADAWYKKGFELWLEGEGKKAVACYRRGLEVNPNHVWLQFELGLAYKNGWGVAKDDAEAVRWSRAAAEEGHAGAQSDLGWMYEHGRGVPRDDVEAVRWFREAAEQGDASAQYSLGKMYDYGRGVTKDHIQAAVWYEKAAEQGHLVAQEAIGSLYKDGRGVPQSDVQAAVWWRKAHNAVEAMKREGSEKRKP